MSITGQPGAGTTTAQTVGNGQTTAGEVPPAGGATTEPNTSGTISQDTVNAIIAKKTAAHKAQLEAVRQESEAMAKLKLATELGLDLDDLDAVKKKLSQQQTDAERLASATKQRDRFAEENAALKQQLEQLTGSVRTGKIKDAVLRAAAGKSVDPDVVYQLIAHELHIADDDSVQGKDGRAVTAHVEHLLTSRPYLAAATGAQGAGSQPAVAQPKGPDGFDPAKRDDRRKAFIDANTRR